MEQGNRKPFTERLSYSPIPYSNRNTAMGNPNRSVLNQRENDALRTIGNHMLHQHQCSLVNHFISDSIDLPQQPYGLAGTFYLCLQTWRQSRVPAEDIYKKALEMAYSIHKRDGFAAVLHTIFNAFEALFISGKKFASLDENSVRLRKFVGRYRLILLALR